MHESAPLQGAKSVGSKPASFPIQALPAWLRLHVEAVSVQTQTPPDLAGMLSLAVLSTALAKRFVVNAYDGWTEPVNLFTVVALPSANRKSSVFKQMVAPLERFEKDEHSRYVPDLAVADSRKRMLEQRLARVQSKSVTATGPEIDTLSDDADQLARELALFKMPMKPRLIVDDCSPEKLASLLAEHGGRIAALAAEGDLFDIAAGRYSKDPNIGVFLKGHSGDELRVDRQGRGSEFVEQPALTLGLAVQPHIIANLAKTRGFRGRGFLGRILYSLPESTVGHRLSNAPAVPQGTRDAYSDALRQLLQVAIPFDDEGEPVAHELDLTEDARERLIAFETALEPRLGKLGDLFTINDWAGKLTGALVRIAGLLHVAKHAFAPDPSAFPIDDDTMASVLMFADYLVDHAGRAFSLMGADTTLSDDDRVLQWYEGRNGEPAVTSLDFCKLGVVGSWVRRPPSSTIAAG